MKRQPFRASITTPLGNVLADKVTYAHNSGIRATEALVRSYARHHGVVMHGEKPHRDETGYARIWRAEGHELVAVVVPAVL